MGFCAIHSQSYDENLGGFCPYCGPPTNEYRTYTSGGTGGKPLEYESEIVSDGGSPVKKHWICRKCGREVDRIIWIRDADQLSLDCSCGYYWHPDPLDKRDAEGEDKI